MANKILGYVLLLIGLTIILTTIYGSYKIFNDKIPVPKLFSVPAEKISSGGDTLQAQTEEIIKKQIGDILPFDSVAKLLNLISWSILAGILIIGGAQIGGLGIKLISIRTNQQA